MGKAYMCSIPVPKKRVYIIFQVSFVIEGLCLGKGLLSREQCYIHLYLQGEGLYKGMGLLSREQGYI